MHAIFAVFYLFFLPVLSRPPNKDQNPETFMSSAAIVFMHAVCKRSKKCLAQKVVRFGSLGWIPITVDSLLTDTPNNGPLPNNGHCYMYQPISPYI